MLRQGLTEHVVVANPRKNPSSEGFNEPFAVCTEGEFSGERERNDESFSLAAELAGITRSTIVRYNRSLLERPINLSSLSRDSLPQLGENSALSYVSYVLLDGEQGRNARKFHANEGSMIHRGERSLVKRIAESIVEKVAEPRARFTFKISRARYRKGKKNGEAQETLVRKFSSRHVDRRSRKQRICKRMPGVARETRLSAIIARGSAHVKRCAN
jgi:hypothetical protein